MTLLSLLSLLYNIYNPAMKHCHYVLKGYNITSSSASLLWHLSVTYYFIVGILLLYAISLAVASGIVGIIVLCGLILLLYLKKIERRQASDEIVIRLFARDERDAKKKAGLLMPRENMQVVEVIVCDNPEADHTLERELELKLAELSLENSLTAYKSNRKNQ